MSNHPGLLDHPQLGMKSHGHIGWCDLMSDDVDKARDFYTKVLGWGDWSSCFTNYKAGQALEGVRREAVGRCP